MISLLIHFFRLVSGFRLPVRLLLICSLRDTRSRPLHPPILTTAMPCLPTLVLTSAALAAAQTSLISTDCFSSQSNFDQYFSYNYPWSSDVHNGGARMTSSQCSLSAGALVQTATYDPSEPDVDDLAINYRSCTVFANQHFTVEEGGGLDFKAEFIAPVERGTWPAFWLTATEGWPPEIDMAEWKGSGLISFNTFNTSSEVDALDREYPDPSSWHTVRAQLRDHGGDVSVGRDRG